MLWASCGTHVTLSKTRTFHHHGFLRHRDAPNPSHTQTIAQPLAQLQPNYKKKQYFQICKSKKIFILRKRTQNCVLCSWALGWAIVGLQLGCPSPKLVLNQRNIDTPRRCRNHNTPMRNPAGRNRRAFSHCTCGNRRAFWHSTCGHHCDRLLASSRGCGNTDARNHVKVVCHLRA
jgi:hypothetical protein